MKQKMKALLSRTIHNGYSWATQPGDIILHGFGTFLSPLRALDASCPGILDRLSVGLLPYCGKFFLAFIEKM